MKKIYIVVITSILGFFLLTLFLSLLHGNGISNTNLEIFIRWSLIFGLLIGFLTLADYLRKIKDIYPVEQMLSSKQSSQLEIEETMQPEALFNFLKNEISKIGWNLIQEDSEKFFLLYNAKSWFNLTKINIIIFKEKENKLKVFIKSYPPIFLEYINYGGLKNYNNVLKIKNIIYEKLDMQK